MRAREFAEPQAAGCIIVARDTGRWCLQQRSDTVSDPGVWSTWGGGREPGESVTQCVRRELAEESGYQGPVRLEPVDSNSQYATFLAHVPYEFEPRLNSESQDYQWSDPEDLPQPLHPGLQQTLGQLTESAAQYNEIEFVCANPDFCDATDPAAQRELSQALQKIPGVTVVYQDQSDYSAGQFSMAAIYSQPAARQRIIKLAQQLGVAVDLERPVSSDYVDRAARGELEGQIVSESSFNQCFSRACRLYDRAQAQGRSATLLQVADYQGDGSAADERWQQLPQYVWKHYVTVIDDTVYDPTAKQFGPDKPEKYSLSQLESEWKEIYQIRSTAVTENTDPGLSYIGNCTEDDVVDDIFGNVSEFARMVELYGDEFAVGDLVVKYDDDKDIHYFYHKNHSVAENFADGRIKGKSRPGRVKRAGASCKGSVSDLRARAKKYSGERGKMYHWCANMKSGRNKKE